MRWLKNKSQNLIPTDAGSVLRRDSITDDLVRLSSESPNFGEDCKNILSVVFVADLQEPSTSYRNSGFALILKDFRLENK